jgi:TonB family protein
MKKIRYLLFFFTLLTVQVGSAQKRLIQEYDQVVEAAKFELDSMMKPIGLLQQEAKKVQVSGEYIMDITVHDKGKVLSVFMVSSDADDVKLQNKAKDLIRTVEFGFKVPKGKTYKFQYIFNFK